MNIFPWRNEVQQSQFHMTTKIKQSIQIKHQLFLTSFPDVQPVSYNAEPNQNYKANLIRSARYAAIMLFLRPDPEIQILNERKTT